jgi:hypothetical protein
MSRIRGILFPNRPVRKPLCECPDGISGATKREWFAQNQAQKVSKYLSYRTTVNNLGYKFTEMKLLTLMSQSRISAGNKTDRRCDDDIIGMRGKNPGNLFKPAYHGRSPNRGAAFYAQAENAVRAAS